MNSETRLRRDWRAILTHGYGVTFMTMPIALGSALGEGLKSGQLQLPYLLLLAYGLASGLAVLTGRTVLTAAEVVSGSIFRRQRVPVESVHEIRTINAGVTAFNLSSSRKMDQTTPANVMVYPD